MTGNQIPRIRIEPPRVGSDGPGAAMLMEAYAVPLDEWQKLCINAWLGTDADGNYTATSCCISLGRQNGKSELLCCRTLYGLLVNAEKILFTANLVRVVKSMFRRLESIFTNPAHPELQDSVKMIRYGAGEESIELKNGGMVQFMSRSRQTARGFDGLSVVILDEAAEISEEQLESVLSALAASSTGQRQIIYAGTPPYPGCPGEVFRRFRETCLLNADKPHHNCWHEWSPEEENMEDIDISDEKLWAACNPAYGIRLTREFTENEMRSLDKAGFCRERLNFWAKPIEGAAAVLAIDPEAWERCKSDDPHPKEGKIAYGVKFTADGSEVVLAGCVMPEIRRSGGRVGTELTRTTPVEVETDDAPAEKTRITLLAIEPTGAGLQWLADWLNERYKQASCVVIDGRGGADVLIEKLRPAGGGTWTFKDSIVKVGVRDVLAAASGLINDIAENSVSWYAQQDELNESALTSTKRPISGGFGFGGTMAAPIEACALALHGCRTSKRNPQRKMRLG